MKRLSKWKKIAVLSIAAAVAACVYAASCHVMYSKMTPWQLEQKIDPEAGTGSTKLKARIDSAAYAGLAFCATTLAIFAALKKYSKK
mgnify:CR=1 FL=1